MDAEEITFFENFSSSLLEDKTEVKRGFRQGKGCVQRFVIILEFH